MQLANSQLAQVRNDIVVFHAKAEEFKVSLDQILSDDINSYLASPGPGDFLFRESQYREIKSNLASSKVRNNDEARKQNKIYMAGAGIGGAVLLWASGSPFLFGLVFGGVTAGALAALLQRRINEVKSQLEQLKSLARAYSENIAEEYRSSIEKLNAAQGTEIRRIDSDSEYQVFEEKEAFDVIKQTLEREQKEFDGRLTPIAHAVKALIEAWNDTNRGISKELDGQLHASANTAPTQLLRIGEIRIPSDAARFAFR